MKLFRILLFVLTLLPCSLASAQSQNANTLFDDVQGDYSRIKQNVQNILAEWDKDKIREGFSSVSGDAVDQLKQALDKLNSLLKNPSGSDNNEQVKKAIEDIKKQYEQLISLETLKNNDYIKGLTEKFEKLKKSGNDFCSRMESIRQYGISGNMPVGIIADYGGIGVKVGVDNLVMHRDDKIESIDGDSTGLHAFAELKLPFLPRQADSSHIIKFAGDIAIQKGSAEVSHNIIYLENDYFRIPIIKNKVDLELISGSSLPSKEWGGCVPDKSRNYVIFDCKEVKEVNLIGRFRFDPSFIKATTFDPPKKKEEKKDEEKKDEQQKEEGGSDEKKAAETADGAKNDGATDGTKNEETKNEGTDGGKKPATEKDVVYAYFSCKAKGGVVTEVCFSSPFELVKLPGFKFMVDEAVVDFSDLKNANGFKFPDNYWDSEGLGLNELNWTGFFLKKLKVLFPNELTLKDAENKETIIEASNVLIDDYGFTGTFVAENIMNKDFGSSGANLTIKKASAEVLKSQFIKGSIEGDAAIPFLSPYSDNEKQPSKDEELKKADEEKKILKMDFMARVGLDNDKYTFFASSKTSLNNQKYKVPFTDLAYISIDKGTGVEITNESDQLGDSGKKLMFALTLNGSLNLKSGTASTSQGSKKLGFDANFEGIEFQGLRFCNIGKHVSIQSLALKGDVECRLMGLTLTLTKLEWKDGKVSNDLSKDVKASDMLGNLEDLSHVIKGGGLNLGSRIQLISGKNTIAPELGGFFKTIYKGLKVNNEDPTDLAKRSKWNFNGIDLNRIALKADFSAFSFDGALDIFKDDETFGKGFRGKLALTLVPLGLSLDMQACFGKTEDINNPGNIYKYWFTRATADISKMEPPIVLFPPSVYLKSVTGGAYYHMYDASNESQFENPDPNGRPKQGFQLADVDNYKPDNTRGLGFIAGIGVYIGTDNLANVQAELNISFYPNWALNKVQFGGNFTMIAPIPSQFKAAIAKYNDALADIESKLDDKIMSNLKEYNGLSKLADNADNSISLEKIRALDKGTITGWLSAEYRVKEKVFHCEANVNADLFKIIKGNAWFRFHTEPGDWYMRMGSNTDPCYLKFMDWVKGQNYFMMGTLPSHTIKPLSPTAASKFGVNQLDYSGNTTTLSHAKGFAFALDVSAKVNVDIMKIAYFQCEMGVGTDLMITNRCYTYKDREPKHWRAYGDIYGFADVQCGLEWPFPEKKFRVFRGAAFVGFQGALPAPVYGHGVMSFSVDILDFIKIDDVTADLTLGNNDIKDCE